MVMSLPSGDQSRGPNSPGEPDTSVTPRWVSVRSRSKRWSSFPCRASKIASRCAPCWLHVLSDNWTATRFPSGDQARVCGRKSFIAGRSRINSARIGASCAACRCHSHQAPLPTITATSSPAMSGMRQRPGRFASRARWVKLSAGQSPVWQAAPRRPAGGLAHAEPQCGCTAFHLTAPRLTPPFQ
jgi:hypothetical protein